MALQAPNGNYRKLSTIDLLSNVCKFQVFENLAHRQAGSTEFHQAVDWWVSLSGLLEWLLTVWDWEKTVLDNLKTVVYNVTKVKTEFADFIDC